MRYRWTELPMPREAIERVSAIGRRQKMPKTLTYANRHGHEIGDNILDYPVDEWSDDDDATYEAESESDTESDDSSVESSNGSSSDDDDQNDDNDCNEPNDFLEGNDEPANELVDDLEDLNQKDSQNSVRTRSKKKE